MESHSKVLGHPLHPMLIVLPLGLLSASLFFDLRAKFRKNPDDTKIARALVGSGVLTGLVAAIPGIIDWMAIAPNTRAKRIGAVHGGGNVLMLLLFALSWKARRPNEPQPSSLAFGLSLAGALLSGLTGWLGGELVYRLSIGVDENAEENAPNSLLG